MKTLEKIRTELLNAHKEIFGVVIGEYMIFNYKGYNISVSENHFEGYSKDCALEVWNFSTGRNKIGICGDIAEALKLAKIMKQGKKIAEFINSKNL